LPASQPRADVPVTLQVYGHLTPQAQRSAVDRLGELIGRAAATGKEGT